MKQIFILGIAFFIHVATIAQKSAYCVLSEESYSYEMIKKKQYPIDSILKLDINTDCEAGKEAEWNCYRFITSLEVSKVIRIKDKTPCMLTINNKPFTGFLQIIKNIDTDFIIYVLQFNNGYHETSNAINNPYLNDDSLPLQQYNIVPYKPVLYLYPTAKQEVSVQLVLQDHKIIHPYPAYNDGWKVIANTDGTLINKATGKEHYCLFWETEGKSFFNEFKSGFVVKGNETSFFLEEKLLALGLNSKEANEFIIFWLPQMENNPFNVIYFSVEEYESISQLKITPKPDTQIRIMMLWEPLSAKISLPEQVLPETPVRKGFVAVEWGGTKIQTVYTAGQNATGQR